MRRKAQQSNRTFMLGTLVLGILVISIVLLFSVLSFRFSKTQTQQPPLVSGDTYQFHFPAHFYPDGCSLFLNDSLFFSGTISDDTVMSICRVGEENALIVVDHTTELMQVVDLSEKKGAYRVVLQLGELVLVPE